MKKLMVLLLLVFFLTPIYPFNRSKNTVILTTSFTDYMVICDFEGYTIVEDIMFITDKWMLNRLMYPVQIRIEWSQ
jgi:hypothetical protein